MPDALPVPRDQRERENMFEAVRSTASLSLQGVSYETLVNRVPPVAPASPMPELREGAWYVLTRDTGKVWHSPFKTRDDAERARMVRGDHNLYGPDDLVTVRLAVVEVVEPEPQAAPSGWRYEVIEGADGTPWVRSRTEDGDTVGEECSPNGITIPHCDREHVAALLRAAKGGTDATG